MAKIWMDAGELLEKTIDIEDMFGCNLSKQKSLVGRTNSKGQGRKSKKVECTNIITGESKIFVSAVEASKYLYFTELHITRLARTGKTTKNGWKVRYIQEVSDGISKCGTSN
ncbi:hypothetical protein I5976_16445 [Clostridioides difficile]|uniref:hypothetical protein n=1 Tax=Clostridioides difficile TaxID=1496 RepID=UPI0009396A37|nr:hypothetical protein [Clostridioides difficile]EII6780891.1 hypothetical protein [Clostridioides difficile]MBH7044040.1 hypothetical protein [Clostridioides difficile]MBY1461855.1 hypothetical protein [Clostridioides difficile]MBY1771465.1 hypothetical protein [Clostridioides difficile]MBY2242525.1 hypothetical protein [Clostridioides difficile]